MFVTIRFVPIPEVLESERMLVEQLGVSGFYHVICRSVSLLCGLPIHPVAARAAGAHSCALYVSCC